MRLQLVGCSHHTTSLALRERLAFSPEQARQALSALRQRFPAVEAVLLSTCNRVEMYTAVEQDDAAPTHQDVVHFLAEFHGLPADQIFDDLFERTGEDAVRHLFFVAASLDSMVIGEAQILGQVKQAYELATTAHSAGPLMHAVFQAALKLARRVASETTINQRRTSVASVAVAEFARQIFERFDDKKVLVIGAGKMGEETIRYLRDEGAQHIAVVNRSYPRAQTLAKACGGKAEPWERLPELLASADLVVSTTGAAEPVVTLEMFRAIEPQRFQRPLAVLDLAVPRDFEPAVGDRLGVYLYTLDDLAAACNRNRADRERQWPAAERIVAEETAAFMADLNHRATAPTIRRLRESCDLVKEEELERLYNKLPQLDDKAQGEIRQAFERLVNKLLHPPLKSLRDESQDGPPHGLIEALKRLFQLKE
ncbi:MAG: glutamyl-tRNA reductase [Planctomycetia bacterium]|nr:glutamyl-tRNA reductase [Planctomycetia bacterium]